MRVLMMTNSYFPIVGGLEQSIRSFSRQLRLMGHEVMIAAPAPQGSDDRLDNVIRLPAIEKFHHTNFSVALPIPGVLDGIMREFSPDIIHSHHPFFVGDMALRLSRQQNVPFVFTYHTMFEHYAYYLPFDEEAARRFMISLAAGYANWADQVIAPCESIKRLLRSREVKSPIAVIPTGIDTDAFAHGDGHGFRRRWHIPHDVYLIGHAGRLSPEKNMVFLTGCLTEFLRQHSKARVLMVGQGPSTIMIKHAFRHAGLEGRLHLAGFLHGQELVDAYHAMDVFAFASLSETQGLVITEAMAAGVPVVAVHAPGVSEVVRDYVNGLGIRSPQTGLFVRALNWASTRSQKRWREVRRNAQATARTFAIERSAKHLVSVYEQLMESSINDENYTSWQAFVGRITAEKDIVTNLIHAGEEALVNA